MPRRRYTRPTSTIAFTVVVLGILGGAVGAAGQLFAPASYSSSTSILLTAPSSDPDRYVADQISIASSQTVLEDAASRASTSSSTLTKTLKIVQVRLSDVVQFTATADSGDDARKYVTSARQAYLDSPVLSKLPLATRDSAVVIQEATRPEKAGLGLALSIIIGLLTGLLVAALVLAVLLRKPAARDEDRVDAGSDLEYVDANGR